MADEKSFEGITEMATQGAEQARKGMENYIDFFQKAMSASPWAGGELSKKVADYAQQNITAACEFAQKLAQAKNLQDLVGIQTEFVQAQMTSLTEQVKDLGEMVSKPAGDSFKDISS